MWMSKRSTWRSGGSGSTPPPQSGSSTGRTTMASKRRTDAELWDVLVAEAEMDRIANMSSDEVKKELLADGFDPSEIGKRGAALAKALLARRASAWQEEARAKRDAM